MAPIRTGSASGRTSDTELRLISVGVRQSGRWMLAAIQGTDVPGRRPTIVSPTAPAPAEAQAPINSRTIPKKSRVGIPAREDGQRITIHEPRIVLRDIYYVRRSGLD